MAKPWSAVEQSPEFQALSSDQKEEARNQYFLDVVAPQVPTDALDSVRAEFDTDTKPTLTKTVTKAVTSAITPAKSVAEQAAEISAGAQDRAAPAPNLSPLSEQGYNTIANVVRKNGTALNVNSPIDDAVNRQAGINQPVLGLDAKTDQNNDLISRAAATAGNDAQTQSKLQAGADAVANMKAAYDADQQSFKTFRNQHELVSGLQSGAAQIAGSLADIPQFAADTVNNVAVNPFLNLFGFNSLAPAHRFQVAKDLETAASNYRPDIANKPISQLRGAGEVSDWIATQAAIQAPQMVGSTAAAFLPKLRAAYLGMMGASSGALQYQQDLDKKVNPRSAWLDGVSNGAFEVLGEALPFEAFDKIGGVIRKLPVSQRAPAISEALKKTLVAVGAMAGQHASEGIGEGITQLGQNASQRYIAGDKTQGLMDQVPEAAAIGAIMATPMAIPHAYHAAMQPQSNESELAQALQQNIDSGTFDQNAIHQEALTRLSPTGTLPAPFPNAPAGSLSSAANIAAAHGINAQGDLHASTVLGTPEPELSSTQGENHGLQATSQTSTETSPASAAQPRPGKVASGTENAAAGNRKAAAPVFNNPHEDALAQHYQNAREAADAAGIPKEHADALAESLKPQDVRDDVTGFFRAEERTPTILRAQKYVEETGQKAHYVDADLANLGGINAHFKNNHAEANAVYRAMTDIFHEEIQKAGDKVIPIRHGGDEFSAVVIGGNGKAIKQATERASARVAEYAKAVGLDNIEHPKYPGDLQRQGIGVYFGQTEIKPGMHIGEIIKEASKGIDAGKNGGSNVIRDERTTSGAGGEVQRQSGRILQSDAGIRPAPANADRRIQSEAHAASPATSLTPNQTAGIPGKHTEVVLPDSRTLPAQWQVVDADHVKATLKEGQNQPRDRSRAASNVQVQGIANNPNYSLLRDSPVMDFGAPTLSHDGAIVGGNGRFEGISRAYDQGSAKDYRAKLEADAADKGIDPASFADMKKPVLVRRITQPFDTRALAVASNSGGSLQYSALEQAKIDGDRMNGLGDIEVNDAGDVVMSADNMQNVRRALAGYTPAELGSMTDKDGMLSQEGVRRIKNALLYKAYGNSSVLSRLVESTDTDMRNVMGALVKSAGAVAGVRADMEKGNKPADADIVKDLLSAVELLDKIKAQGASVDQYLAQDAMFGKEYTEEAAYILKVLADSIRSQKRMAEFIKSYYDALASEDHLTGSMFDTVPVSNKERLSHAAGQAEAERAADTGGETAPAGNHAQDQHQSEDAQRAAAGSQQGQQDTGVSSSTPQSLKSADIPAEDDASTLKSKGDSVRAAFKLFSDIPDADSISVHGFNSLNIKRKRVVLSHVVGLLNDKQVLSSVIESIPVNVMNSLIWGKWSANELLHNPSMLTHRLSVAGDVPVTKPVVSFVDSLIGLVKGMATSNRAENSGLLHGSASSKGVSTVGASQQARLDAGSGAEMPAVLSSNPVSASSKGVSTSVAGEIKDGHVGININGQLDTVNVNPTEAQKKSGTYKKGHIIWNGLDITIENPQGSTRSGTDANGKAWEVTMPATYGYIKRTEGADGDHIDVYLGKHLDSDKVFVIDQKDLKTGKFDEHKVMLGFPTLREAERIYKSGFSDKKGAERMGAVTPMSVEEFKQWAKTEDTTKPVGNLAGERLQNATAPEHVATETGVTVQELKQISKAFRDAIDSGEDSDVTHIFDAPAKQDIVRLNDKVKVYVKDKGWMTPKEARAEIAKWKENAQKQGDDEKSRSANSDKVVLSLFDLSGEWSKPWEEAGYQVYRFDIQADPDMGDVNNFSTEFFGDWFGDFEGMDVYAILAATPCTDFAVSGARHFAAKDADGRTVSSIKLVKKTLAAIEYFKPAVWALENPVGRIEELTGLPPWRLSFDPNHLGDPYTKKTLIWGRFNGDLPIAPVEPTEGSKMHMKYGGKSMATKNARSVTPEGFSYGFFQANNAIDNPVLAVANKYDRLDRNVIRKAIDAGVTPKQIDNSVEDFYYMDMDDEAANDAIRELIPENPNGTKKPNSNDDAGRTKAQADMESALAEMGDIFRTFAARNLLPEDKPKLMPVLVNMFDAAFRLGYYDMKKAGQYVREQLAKLDRRLATFIPKAWMDEAARQAHKNMPDGFFENKGLFAEKPVLESYTNSDVLARESAKAKAEEESKKEAPAKHVTSDQTDLFNTQNSLFNSNRDQPVVKDSLTTQPESSIAQDGNVKHDNGEKVYPDHLTNADKNSDIRNFKLPALREFVPGEVLQRVNSIIAKAPKQANISISAGDRAAAEAALRPLIEKAEKNKPEFDLLVVEAAKEAGIGEILVPVKGLVRASEKLHSDYRSAPDLFGERKYLTDKMRDLLRATIVVRSAEDVPAAIAAVKKHFTIESGRLNNRFDNPLPTGYRDVLINVVLKDGTKAEIQINVPEMLSAKDVGHKLYDISRSTGASNQEARDAIDAQKALYDAAFSRAFNSKNLSSGTSNKYEDGMLGSSHNESPSPRNHLSPTLQNGSPLSDSKNLEPAGNLSGSFISDTSKHTIAKNASGVHNEIADSGINTTEASNHDNRPARARSTQRKGTATNGGAAGEQQSGSVHTRALGRDIVANQLPPVADSEGQGAGRGENAAGKGGDTQQREGSGKRDRAEKPAGFPAGRDIPAKSGQNYHFTDSDLDYKGSWIAKAKQNVDAIELVKKLEAEGRQATRAEQQVLAKFIGWGAFDIRNKIFDPQIDRVRRSVDAYNDAMRWLTNNKKEVISRTDYGSPYYTVKSMLEAANVSVPWGTDINKAMLEKLANKESVQWIELRDKLKELLTDDEWQTAERSTQYAHYTGKEVVNEMWRAFDRMGFKGGAIIEPGSGNGVFPGLMPEAVANNSIYTGIEYDKLTGAILKQLQPDERILVESFIDSTLPDNFYDVAIGNPPFSDSKVLSDPKYKKHGFALHDYFFAKTLDKVKPGGVLAFVTSRYTMDKQGDKARQYLAERADLLGAIRLPETAFKKNAGTEVVTDILFLRKKEPGKNFVGQDWMKLDKIKVKGGDHLINEYFAKHPEMVLGEGALDRNGMYSENQYTVLQNKSVPIEKLLADAVDRLPQSLFHPELDSAVTAAQVREIDWNPKAKKEGNYYVADDGRLMQVENRAGVPAKAAAKDLPMLKSFVALRDALNQAQYDQLNNGDWETSLKDLHKQYKEFVKDHGHILQNTVTERVSKVEDEETGEIIEDVIQNRRFTLINKLNDDPEYTKVMALETINDETGKISESPFLTQRMLEKRKEAAISTPHDALLSSLNDIGRVDIPLIAERLGMSDKETISALGSAIYESPAHGWQMADEYLSGNVKAKLKEAEEAAKSDRRFERNVEALLQAQPAPVPPSDITATIGMNWIPSAVYESFLREKTGVKASIVYNEHTGQWSVKALSGYSTPQATSDWGTPQRNAADIIEAGLTGRPIRITKTEGSGADKKVVFDANATEAANQKLKEMKEAFKDWIWQDSARTDKLVALYNDKFNTTVARKFDGRHLTLPGSTSTISVFDHVKRGAWRIIQSGNTYLAHAVGSGKTWQMVISAMEQKRLGLINKPMVVVPNHMLQQFAQEWMQLYPASRLMVADEKQFHTDNRKRFVARAAMSDLDGVIITHSAFKLLDLDPEFKQKMIQEQLDYMEAALSDILDEEGEKDAKKSRNPKVRDIQNRIEKLEERLKASMSGEGKDKAVRFDEMGVDFLYVDEAHEYRKLPFTTARQVKGIDSSGSERAFDLYMKTRWLEEKHPGRSLVMASGTPVTNTLAEIYSVQRFMQPDVLEQRGLQDFDAWASMFGEEHTEIEADASGKYSPVTRFSKFVNVPELTQMFREFADVLTSDHLAEMLGDKRPKLKNGARKIVVTPQVDDYLAYKDELAQRLKVSRNWKPSRDEPNNPDPIIKIIGDGRLAAIDMRFIDPSLPSDPHSKLNQMIDGVIRSYKKYNDFEYVNKDGSVDPVKGATQMVFSDLGFGAGVAEHRGFNARAWVEKRLRDAGIPISQVAFMSDYKKSAAKVKLFKDVNAGRVRVLIGSSKNMGTGVNAQQRLRSLHHLDTPWYPADLEQREGRIVRQGNKNRHVRVYAYSTKGSYDTVMWQLLARKQRFIDQALSGDSSVRQLDDISESSQFQMATAMTAGDERAIQLAGLKADIEKYDRLFRAHEENRMRMKEAYQLAGNTISVSERKLPDAEKMAASIKDLSGDKFTAKAGKHTYTERKEWGEALLAKLKDYEDHATEGHETVGEISGFKINLIGNLDRNNDGKVLGYYARLEMRVGEDGVILARDSNDSAIGMTMRATNALVAIQRKPDEYLQAISDAKSKRNALEGRIEAPFQFSEELASKKKEAAQLEQDMLADSNKAEVSELEAKAKAFAEQHHGDIDQRRKFTDEPYITHPAGVVEVLKTVAHTPEMAAAAWAHDTVEDTKATLEDVRRELGDKVAELVNELTNPNKATSTEAKTIKLADIIHNVSGLDEAEQSFAKRYAAQKLEQLESLKGGDEKLWQKAREVINEHAGQPLLSQGESGMPAIPADRVRAITSEFSKNLKHGKLIVVPSVNEIPELVAAAIGDGGVIEGAYVGNGRAYIVANAFNSEQRVYEVVQHELSHMAAEELLDTAEYKRTITSVRMLLKAGNPTLTKLGEEVDKYQPDLPEKLRVKEILAKAVETGEYKKLGALKSLMADIMRAFKRIARSMGINTKYVNTMTEPEVMSAMRGAMRALYRETQTLDDALKESEQYDQKERIPRTEYERALKEAGLFSRGGAQYAQQSQSRKSMENDISLIDKAFALPFKLVGWNSIVSKGTDALLSKLGELVPETVKAGIVDNYGLDPAYIDSKAEMKAREAAQNRKAHGMIEMLAGLNRAESRVAYYWMQEKPESAGEKQLLEQLPEQSREVLSKLKKLISDLGHEAVRLGQMTNEAYQRNNMAYLHRTYAKHILAEESAISKFMRARAMKVKGDQYKGRGIFDEVPMAMIGGETISRKLKSGQADKQFVGEKMTRFERRDASTEAMEPLTGMTSKPLGKLREVVYWPASEAVPAKYGDWVNAGTFEVRDTKGDKLVLWRDLTREERNRLGELDEVRYAVAQTLQAMVHDIEVGRFLEWTAKQYGKATPEGKEVEASESMIRAYQQHEWVQVPTTNIPGSKTKKYGALAGLYVNGAVWNDIRQAAGGKFTPWGDSFASVLRFWKQAKTVWSPTVHMNNVMANFVMADWNDMRSVDLADAMRVWARSDKEGSKQLFERFQDSGALGGMFQSNEAMRDEIKKRLEEMKDDLTGNADNEMGAMAKVLHLMSMAMVQPVKTYANVTAKAYQAEDEFFRLAIFLKAIRHGKSDIEAGRMARHAFLNYDINAPWIQYARQTVLPFVSFFYRAAPMLFNTAKNKPWKIAKLVAFAYMLNALGYALAGGGDDEDKDRKLMPDEKSGSVWGLVPKMIRMPWNHEDGSPVFLDIRRWVPVGDIVDMDMGAGMLPPWVTPAGFWVSLGEVLGNYSMFSKKEITNDTDSGTEAAEKRLDYLFKSMMPNVPLPNPINLQLGDTSINPFNLDQGSFQSYGWSGIEKAVNRRENAIGEVRTVPQAIANTLGIKVGTYPRDNMEAAAVMDFKRKDSEIQDKIKTLARDYSKLDNPSPAQQAIFERGIQRQKEKIQKLADDLGRKVN